MDRARRLLVRVNGSQKRAQPGGLNNGEPLLLYAVSASQERKTNVQATLNGTHVNHVELQIITTSNSLYGRVRRDEGRPPTLAERELWRERDLAPPSLPKPSQAPFFFFSIREKVGRRGNGKGGGGRGRGGYVGGKGARERVRWGRVGGI